MARPRFLRTGPRGRTAAVLLAALSFATFALTGCASDDTGAGSVVDGPLPTEVPSGTTLVIADQSELLRHQLLLSGELDKLPFEVEFANFVGGPAILESFRAGAADVAWVGDVPPIHALAAKQDVPIVAASQIDTAALKFAVAPGVSVNGIADIKGRKIAYAEGTSQQAAVLRLLDKAGLATSDVELVRIQLAEFLDAVRTGQVDIAPLGEPNVTRFLRTSGTSLIPDADTAGTYPGLTYLYARRDVVRDPAKAAATRALVAAYVRSWQWVNDHRAEWAQKYYVDNQKISIEDANRIVESRGTITFPHLDQRLIDRQQATIDAIDAAGELPRKIQAADGFDLRFDAVITETVGQVGASFEPGSN
ncbi:ABC transporter substrate-binding protein [Nocardia sp. NPDC059180]|uniref:ABC transporter substrate-binding protein n=1 Tax=Nocardia sp. NPDC059180 TaxID=3346761 RepID=UPI0036806C85